MNIKIIARARDALWRCVADPKLCGADVPAMTDVVPHSLDDEFIE